MVLALIAKSDAIHRVLGKSNKQICQRTFSISRVQRANHAEFALCRGERTSRSNVLDKPSAEGKSRSVCTMPRRENDYYEETTSCLCRVSAVVLPCVFLRLRKRRQSGGRAKAERRHSGKTRTKLGTSRPFPSAKIARNNDITNFLEQKMSLFPLL